MNHPPARPRFPGFDSLRAYAALFVVVGHIPMNQASLGLPSPAPAAFFFRGAPAVSFFFTLSGFLITYLLLDEQQRQGRIDVRAFYLRRVLRIWPLYFATIAFGLFFYNALLPWLGIPYRVEYSLGLAIVLYLFFLPNLINSLYTVGGLLNPSWSIGIEEQFYLAWAPALRRWHHRLPRLAATVLAVSFAGFLVNRLNPFHLAEMVKFFDQLKFHFMAAGALAAWAVRQRREALLALPVFKHGWLQWALGLFLAQYFLVDLWPMPWWLEELVQLGLFTWLLIEVGVNPRRRMPLENRFAEWLGTISYGIYMLHMIAIYFTSWLFKNSQWWVGSTWLYHLGYYGLAVALTILLSYLSFRFFEGPLLALKTRLAR